MTLKRFTDDEFKIQLVYTQLVAFQLLRRLNVLFIIFHHNFFQNQFLNTWQSTKEINRTIDLKTKHERELL